MAKASSSAAWVEFLLRARRLARRPLDPPMVDDVVQILGELPQYRQQDRLAYVSWQSALELTVAQRSALERLENAVPSE